MGVDLETARFLMGSREEGASFKQTVTLGRQNYNLSNKEMAGLLREYGLDPAQYPKLFATKWNRFRYAEEFWEALGAEKQESLDASNFEGATLIHDLNKPIPAELKGKFDALCDFGTLEHVFDVPTAIRNCAQMIKVGGHFFAQTPANNYLGHGFYQFSPELYYRVFSPANGFVVERMVAVAYGLRRKWYAVPDPEAIKARTHAVNCFPVILFVRAKRTADVPMFTEMPQQSDLVAQWKDEAEPAQRGIVDKFSDPKLASLKLMLLENIPGFARVLESLRFSWMAPQWSLRNSDLFTPIRKKGWGKKS